MPALYILRCSACGTERHAASGGKAVQLNDGTISPLMHPGEDYHLRQMGFDPEEASANAQTVYGTEMLCLRCGGVYVRWRSLPPPPPFKTGCGFLVGTSLVVIGSAAAAWAMTLELRTGSGWGFGLCIVPVAIVWAVIGGWWNDWKQSRQYRKQLQRYTASLPNRPLLTDTLCCQHCRDEQLVPITEASSREPFPCPSCGAQAVHVHSDGVS